METEDTEAIKQVGRIEGEGRKDKESRSDKEEVERGDGRDCTVSIPVWDEVPGPKNMEEISRTIEV